ncbi:hypothetical protein LZ188_22165, partial [Rhodovulum sulfidophilum]|nr:hypothetical protein [Rhodovulum sulfidophilum]
IKLRAEAKKAKDYAKADRIRDLLSRAGFSLKDTPDGTEVSIDMLRLAQFLPSSRHGEVRVYVMQPGTEEYAETVSGVRKFLRRELSALT